MVVGTFVGGVVGLEPEPELPLVDPEPEPAGAGHDSETLNTGSFTGNDTDASGVPAGTANDSCAPPSTVTVTVHVSADAEVGSIANPANNDATAADVLSALTPAW